MGSSYFIRVLGSSPTQGMFVCVHLCLSSRDRTAGAERTAVPSAPPAPSGTHTCGQCVLVSSHFEEFLKRIYRIRILLNDGSTVAIINCPNSFNRFLARH